MSGRGLGRILNPIGVAGDKIGGIGGAIIDPAGGVAKKVGGQRGAIIDPPTALRNPDRFVRKPLIITQEEFNRRQKGKQRKALLLDEE